MCLLWRWKVPLIEGLFVRKMTEFKKCILTNSAYSYIMLRVTIEVNYAFAMQILVHGRDF